MEPPHEINNGHESREAVEHVHGSNGTCSHQHVEDKDTSGSRLLMTLALNLIIPMAQLIGGVYAHSMALISDATHNFSDFVAVLLAYIAHRIGRKGASFQNTFGYKRAEILAATMNVAILIDASAFIVYGAVYRFFLSCGSVGSVGQQD